MNVRSLALSTELSLAATRGRIIDRGDYLVIETPDDPGYYDGNVLVFPAPPQVGEVAYWTRRFGEELGRNPEIRHVTLWWDGVTGDVGAADELRAAGFTISVNQVMTAETVAAAPAPLPIRPLTADEVLATADLAYTIGDRHDEIYRSFLDRRAAWHSRLVASDRAGFWGAFDGDTLVASLGTVWLGSLARYQDVQTLPSHRGRGLASALLAASAREAFAHGCERVVIVADPSSPAARVYTRAGFQIIEHTAGAQRVAARSA